MKKEHITRISRPCPICLFFWESSPKSRTFQVTHVTWDDLATTTCAAKISPKMRPIVGLLVSTCQSRYLFVWGLKPVQVLAWWSCFPQHFLGSETSWRCLPVSKSLITYNTNMMRTYHGISCSKNIFPVIFTHINPSKIPYKSHQSSIS